MTITETTLGTTGDEEQRAAIATLIGETVAALLPADEAWSVADGNGTDLPPAPNAAVGARVGDHVVVIVATSTLSRRIQAGPPPADDLLDGVVPALQGVAEVLGLDAADAPVPMDADAVAAEVSERSLTCRLLDGADHHATVIVTPPAPTEDGPDAAEFQPIVGDGVATGQSPLDVLHEVEMGVTVELGRTRMPLRDILTVVPGSVIELDRAASAPVDVLVNGTLIARGEVVVIDEEFGIRITEVIGHEQTIHGDADS